MMLPADSISRKPTKTEVAAAVGGTIPDVLDHKLRILFCGINPSLYSAATGHHFARPGNRFWPALQAAGITAEILSPADDRGLLDSGCGLTNLVARATARADELAQQEFRDGARELTKKVKKYQPDCVAFLGIGAYRTAFDRKQACIGLQEELLGDTAIWVLPNPSGLNAHYQLPDFARVFRELYES